jgi:hypothetical protein
MRQNQFGIFLVSLFFIILSGCTSTSGGNYGRDYALREADWIKEGKPIIFDSRTWNPTEYIENHLDSEMDYVGEFQKVPFYVERRQIKPYNRIYTKFDYHKYRLFLEKKNYDSN